MKILKHEKDKTGDFQQRVFIHIPIGLLIGIPILGHPLLKIFLEYEKNEDLHTSDEAWKDFFGAMIGASITILLLLGLIILLII